MLKNMPSISAVNRVRWFRKHSRIFAFNTTQLLLSKLRQITMSSFLVTVAPMGCTMSKMKLLQICIIVMQLFQHNNTTGQIMTTFPSTSELRKWYNLMVLTTNVCRQVSNVNNITSRITQLVFKVCKTRISTLFAQNSTLNHTFSTLQTLGSARFHSLMNSSYQAFTSNTWILPEYTAPLGS